MSLPATMPAAQRGKPRWFIPAIFGAAVILVAATALTTWVLTRDQPVNAAASTLADSRARSACEQLQSIPADQLTIPDRLVYVAVNAKDAVGPVHDIGVELGVQVDTMQAATTTAVRDRTKLSMMDTAMRMLVVCINAGYPPK